WVSPAEIRIEAEGDQRRATHLSTGEDIQIGAIEKMSKSKKNTIDPDDIIDTYGADTIRWFILSDSPPERDVIWSEEGVQGAARFVQQVWRLLQDIIPLLSPVAATRSETLADTPPALALRKQVHAHVLRIQENIERLRFNTAIADVRKLTNIMAEAL